MPDYTDDYLIHNPDALNEYNSENANDFDKSISYWNHPMTDRQAKNLLTRIRRAFEYRNGVIDQDTRWKATEVPSITASINNIDLTKKPSGDYNIEAMDDDIVANDDTFEASDANIIKAIDGIAIINSLLRINEIDSTIENAANTSYKKIRKAFDNGQSYQNHKKDYMINGVSLTDLFPDATDVDIVTARDRYLNVITVNVNSNDFEFESDDIVERESQRDYIFNTLEDIADIIKYVKNFTDTYIKPLSDATDTHQNITSAFDYYLLDYIVQMIEAENILFEALLTKYEKIVLTNDDRSTREIIPLNTQRRQYNHAPFVGSMCNGSCTGLCFGSCESTCNGCGGCTGYCSSYCGGSCYGQCGNAACDSNCSGTCKTGCKDACQGLCAKQCSEACESACTGTCTTQCKDGCKGKCSSSCDNQCISGCNDGCFSKCTGGCGQSCAGSASAKNPISTTQPRDVKTITVTQTLNPYHVSDMKEQNHTSGYSTCQDQCGSQCGACGGSCSSSCGGCGSTCSGYCGSGCSATCGGRCTHGSSSQ